MATIASGGMNIVNFSFEECVINRLGGKGLLREYVVVGRRKNLYQAKQLKEIENFFPQAMLFGFLILYCTKRIDIC